MGRVPMPRAFVVVVVLCTSVVAPFAFGDTTGPDPSGPPGIRIIAPGGAPTASYVGLLDWLLMVRILVPGG